MKRIRYGYVYLALGIVGLLGGFLYWNFWGCTDSCPIDSSWKLSMLRGGVVGLCLAAIVQPSPKKETKEEA
jgi:hypothetical protein